jgi:hypothetical protein
MINATSIQLQRERGCRSVELAETIVVALIALTIINTATAISGVRDAQEL